MIQFNLLTGDKAGTSWAARRFPVRVGRSSAADLQLADAGIWDEHFEVRFKPGAGFMLAVQPGALLAVNGEPMRDAVLRNGDVITVGALQMQFWLSRARQTGLAWREWLTWAGIAAVSLLQVALVYWLRA